MLILALSDVHERVSRLKTLASRLYELNKKPDLTIIAGDITYFKRREIAEKILASVSREIETPVLFIPGNCDPVDLLYTRRVDDKVFNIHGLPFTFDNYTFYGIGGSGITPFHTFIEYSEEEFRQLLESARTSITNKRLIMVTHQPIYGYFDEVNGENVGSRAFLEYIDILKPLVWITGHIHEHSGWTTHGETFIVHPGPFMKGYYSIIEIDGSNVLRVSIDRIQ